MPTLECSTVRESDVTLVEARLACDARQRVSVQATHDSPVWPPRREGVPAAGWSDDGWTGVVPANGTVALGYATPGDVPGRPLRITGTHPPDEETVTARDAIRSLGDARPPRDAVDVATPDGGGAGKAEPAVGPGGLDAIANRVDRAEALATAESVEDARASVSEVGGIDAVRDLATQLERDREQLETLGRRVDELRTRAAVEVPVEDLARIV